MNILHVASEVAPFAQTGGLADVVAGLPAALAELPAVTSVGVLVPLYRGVASRVAAAGYVLETGPAVALNVGPSAFAATLQLARVGKVAYGFVDCPALFDRDGSLYGPGGTDDFVDNHLRFGALGAAAGVFGEAIVGGPVDVLHVHDWQGALAAVYARNAGTPAKIVTTIHNLAYRGIFPKSAMTDLGIPWSWFTQTGIEFWDQVCLLKGGLAAADAVTTVSPSYAREILTPARGEALDGYLRAHVASKLTGIVNGIDIAEWNPMTDPALAAPFSVDALAGKDTCRTAIARELGLTLGARDALIAVISRMADQKGLDLVAEVAPDLVALGVRLIVLGSGERALEDRFRWLGDAFAGQIAVHIGFDHALSRRIYAGADLFLMPSRFEPCGLGQLYAQRYGTIPIVHAVGGLRDTVDDPGDAGLATGHGTGVRFSAMTPTALVDAITRGLRIIRSPALRTAVRRAAMTRDVSWAASAQQYVALYASLGVS